MHLCFAELSGENSDSQFSSVGVEPVVYRLILLMCDHVMELEEIFVLGALSVFFSTDLSLVNN